MRLAQLLVALSGFVVIWARSFGLRDGGDSYGCNLMTTKYGCIDFDFDGGPGNTRIGCWDDVPPGQPQTIMWWASAPNVTTDFTLRTGDGAPASDPTQYNPGERMPLYVTSVKSGHYYEGMLLYAVDKNELRVGDWDIPKDSNPEWQAHPGTVCPKSIMHASAVYKRRVTRYSFITPPVGTGPITFRVMWKDGQPNPTTHGGFWLPPRNITLQEKSNVVPSIWSLALDGESCAQHCDALNSVCVPSAQAGMFSAADEKEILRIFPCQKTYFSECSTPGPRVVNKDENLCGFLDNATNCLGRSGVPNPNCVTPSSSGTPLLCKCLPQGTAGAQLGAANSARSLHSLLFLVISCFWTVFGGGRSSNNFIVTFIVVLCFCAYTVNAHNWIEGTRGRAKNMQASTVQPALPPVHPLKIDMQIYTGQEVQIEWSTAHGGINYFVIMSQSDEVHLSDNTEDNLEDYILNAPANSASLHDGAANLTNSRFQKFGRNGASTPLGTTYSASIASSDPMYLGDRPSVWATGGLSNQYSYVPQSIQDDRRVSYVNVQYPWIEAVHKYSNVGSDIDAIRLTIPARKGAGRYIIHYIWSSYRDIYDIDVHTPPTPGAKVANPYGVTDNSTITYMQFDHCIFENVLYSDKCWEAPGSGEFARKKCDLDGPSCVAYALVPVRTLSPWDDYTSIPYQTTDANPALSAGCNLTDLRSRLMPDGMASFTVQYYRGFNNGASPPWTIFTDAENIAWYSTCYVKLSPLKFDLPITSLPVAPVNTLPFRFGNKCIPCEDRGMNLSTGPRWRVADYCVDCDAEPVAVKRSTQIVPRIVSQSPATAFDASFDCQNSPTAPPCASILWLTLAGSAWMYEEDCLIKVSTTPGCSKYGAWMDGNYDLRYPGDWYYSNFQAGKNCMCWKTTASLPPPTKSDTSGWSTFTLA